MFDLESSDGDNGFALYRTFQVAEEERNYTLTIENYKGYNIGNGMTNNMMFTTKDVDNDEWGNFNCAQRKTGGWWFKKCSPAFLTGGYDFSDNEDMSSWKTWSSNKGIRMAEMKIRSQSGKPTFRIL